MLTPYTCNLLQRFALGHIRVTSWRCTVGRDKRYPTRSTQMQTLRTPCWASSSNQHAWSHCIWERHTWDGVTLSHTVICAGNGDQPQMEYFWGPECLDPAPQLPLFPMEVLKDRSTRKRGHLRDKILAIISWASDQQLNSAFPVKEEFKTQVRPETKCSLYLTKNSQPNSDFSHLPLSHVRSKNVGLALC